MVISMSMQMEAGAQPSSGAESPMPPIDPKYPDLPATKWYEYGFKEGLPRLLDMFDRQQVRVTSHMVVRRSIFTRSWPGKLCSEGTKRPATDKRGPRNIP